MTRKRPPRRNRRNLRTKTVRRAAIKRYLADCGCGDCVRERAARK